MCHWLINLPVAKMRQFCREGSQFWCFLSPVDMALWNRPWSTGQEKEGPLCSAWGPFHSPASWVIHTLVHMTFQLFCLPWLRDKNPKDREKEQVREGFKNLLIIHPNPIPISAGLIIWIATSTSLLIKVTAEQHLLMLQNPYFPLYFMKSLVRAKQNANHKSGSYQQNIQFINETNL